MSPVAYTLFPPLIYVSSPPVAQDLGQMSYMYAYMSQPKHQLETFKAWAGKSSDISYYLNSHHVDFCEWACFGTARPVKVVAMVKVNCH